MDEEDGGNPKGPKKAPRMLLHPEHELHKYFWWRQLRKLLVPKRADAIRRGPQCSLVLANVCRVDG